MKGENKQTNKQTNKQDKKQEFPAASKAKAVFGSKK